MCSVNVAMNSRVPESLLHTASQELLQTNTENLR